MGIPPGTGVVHGQQDSPLWRRRSRGYPDRSGTPALRAATGGGGHHGEGQDDHHHDQKSDVNYPSLQYERDESEAWKAHIMMDHYQHRGKFWNTGEHEELIRYVLTALVGITQGCVAYFTNLLSAYFIEHKFDSIYEILESNHDEDGQQQYHQYQIILYAYFKFVFILHKSKRVL